MSMCYLCDLCAHQSEVLGWDRSSFYTCDATKRKGPMAFDYGKQDPYEICEHFEPKEGSDDRTMR